MLPWDRAAVDATTGIKAALAAAGTPIGPNGTAIAGHAVATGAVLITNNVREFERIAGLMLEDWSRQVILCSEKRARGYTTTGAQAGKRIR